ncbi:polyketide synthase dehydratase domain-containing protein, partial [Nonomuraea zeae]|uniref:polyketide synthase dehydratase domain-containing protein n=1 Tax=Nonomuraea zeae TaxID=1642303 RepID=UPI00197DEB1F
MELPTYAFQRRPYWLDAPRTLGDASELGLAPCAHPLLGAGTDLPDGGRLFTGRIGAGSSPWLADHVVMGSVIMPGSAFVELALHVADVAGAAGVEELTFQAPLAFPADRPVQIQVTLSGNDLAIHSRPTSEDPWTCHASGSLLGEAPADAETHPAAGPPPDAEPIAVETFYDELVAAGFEYGPAFQGLRAAWRHGGDVYAEVELAEEQRQEAGQYAIHPALLDAALHTAGLLESRQAGLAFSWSGITVSRPGAAKVRVRLSPGTGGSLSLTIADEDDRPVARIAGLAMRPVTAPRRLPYRLEWSAAPPRRDGVPEAVVVRPAAGELPQQVHETAERTLALVQEWLAEDRDGRLAVVTSGAVAVDDAEDVRDLAGAAVWGLVRTAQAEHPDRFVLVDVDDPDALPAALATGEPQVVMRAGQARIPRLTRLTQTLSLIPI